MRVAPDEPRRRPNAVPACEFSFIPFVLRGRRERERGPGGEDPAGTGFSAPEPLSLSPSPFRLPVAHPPSPETQKSSLTSVCFAWPRQALSYRSTTKKKRHRQLLGLKDRKRRTLSLLLLRQRFGLIARLSETRATVTRLRSEANSARWVVKTRTARDVGWESSQRVKGGTAGRFGGFFTCMEYKYSCISHLQLPYGSVGGE